jgi:hypothetical protein
MDAVIDGTAIGRHVSSRLLALRLKLEYALARPKQETELSGNVTIIVTSPLPGRIGGGQAKALADATGSGESSEGRQSPIIAITSTKESAETQAISERPDILLTPSLHRAGALRADPNAGMTPEQRRAAERDAWQAERAAMAARPALTVAVSVATDDVHDKPPPGESQP